MERLNTSIAPARISSSVIWPLLESVPCCVEEDCDAVDELFVPDCGLAEPCCEVEEACWSAPEGWLETLPWLLDEPEAGLDDCDEDLLLEDELEEELEDELDGELDDELEGGLGIELLDCSVSGGLHAASDRNNIASAGIDQIPFMFRIVFRIDSD